MAHDRYVLPADTGDVVNIVMVEKRHIASTEVSGQGGTGISRNNAVTGAQLAGGTESVPSDAKKCCIWFEKPVIAALKPGHRRTVFVLCWLFYLLLCPSPCAVVSTG